MMLVKTTRTDVISYLLLLIFIFITHARDINVQAQGTIDRNDGSDIMRNACSIILKENMYTRCSLRV